MVWRGPRNKRADPLLGDKGQWASNRRYWRGQLPTPCARCGYMINKDVPYRGAGGKINKGALVVGHIVGRAEARALGWTETMINALGNTQPEHAKCSWGSGAVYGQQRQHMIRSGSDHGVSTSTHTGAASLGTGKESLTPSHYPEHTSRW